jgi:high-affinity Fe2+/Pb2+ permease
MSVVHLHLAINHSPLYAELFAFGLLAIGLLRRNRTLVTSGLVMTIVAALCAGGAFMSGDGAAQAIDKGAPIAGVDKQMIGPHDEAAGYLLAAACIVGGAGIVALFLGRRGERPRWLEVVVTLLVLVTITIAIRTALLGGRIHHPEVRDVIHG